MNCKSCGAPVRDGQNFCDFCGTQIEHAKPQNVIINNYYAAPQPTYYAPFQPQAVYTPRCVSTKNKWVAFLLCFFLGYFGAHYFYVGKGGTGLLYLFTCGLFGIGWLVDLFRIPCGAFQDRSMLPLK